MKEKGWEESGPKAHSKNSVFGIPMIRYSLVAFQCHRADKSYGHESLMTSTSVLISMVATGLGVMVWLRGCIALKCSEELQKRVRLSLRRICPNWAPLASFPKPFIIGMNQTLTLT